MAVRFSNGFRCAVLGNAYYIDTGTHDLAFGDGTGDGGNDCITDAQNRFLKWGYKVGDRIVTLGSVANADDWNEAADVTLLVVSANKIQFAAGTVVGGLAFTTGTSLTGYLGGNGTSQTGLGTNNGGSIKGLLDYGVLDIYSGTQPASADDAEAGTKLVSITTGSVAYTPATGTNGLVWGSVSEGVLSKGTGVWSGVGLAAGTATWARFYGIIQVTGATGPDNSAANAIRIDFGVATSGTALTISDTTIVIGATTTVDTATLTFPAS